MSDRVPTEASPEAVSTTEILEEVELEQVGTSEVIDLYEKAMSHYFVAASYYDGTVRFSSTDTVPITSR
jgi:hypothetical protein